MEPTNLNSSDDPQLEQWLRSTAVPEIADDGFTARVMANLPAPEPHGAPRFSWTRLAAMLIGASAGAAVLPWRSLVLPNQVLLVRVGESVTNPAFVCGVSISVLCVAMIFVPRLQRMWT